MILEQTPAKACKQLMNTCHYYYQLIKSNDQLIFQKRALNNRLYSTTKRNKEPSWFIELLNQEYVEDLIESDTKVVDLVNLKVYPAIINQRPKGFGSDTDIIASLVDFGTSFHFSTGGKLCFSQSDVMDRLYILDFEYHIDCIQSTEYGYFFFSEQTNDNEAVLSGILPGFDRLNWQFGKGTGEWLNEDNSTILGNNSGIRGDGQFLIDIIDKYSGYYEYHISFVNDDGKPGYKIITNDRIIEAGLRKWTSVSKNYCISFTVLNELVIFNRYSELVYRQPAFAFKKLPVVPFSAINQHGKYLLYLENDTCNEAILYATNIEKLISSSEEPAAAPPRWHAVARLPRQYFWSWSGEYHTMYCDSNRYVYLTGLNNEVCDFKNMLIVLDLLKPELSKCFVAYCEGEEEEYFGLNLDIHDVERHLGAWFIDEHGVVCWYAKQFCYALADVHDEEINEQVETEFELESQEFQ